MVRNSALASGRQVSSALRGVEGAAGAPIRDKARLRGRPPQAAGAQPFQEGSVRQPARTAPENLPALLVDALNEKVVATIDGERREITKREAPELFQRFANNMFWRISAANIGQVPIIRSGVTHPFRVDRPSAQMPRE